VLAHAAAGADAVIAALSRSLDAPVLAVAPGPREAEELAAGVAAFLGPERVAEFPAWEGLPYEGISPSPSVAAKRADAVRRLRGVEGAFVLVCPVLAAMHRLVPTLGTLESIVFERGAELAPDTLAERLAELGYVRADVVEHRGEFAVRGGIVDVFPGIARRPLRAEFLGEEIESLLEGKDE
jgi:transcription-repair coupling factor (superfamily II helicase)